MREPKPTTRASFIEAYVDATPWAYCTTAVAVWDALHNREVLSDEVDEDPQ